ncbi:MAG: hypothetical protein ABII90_14300 [Bacteroidota bacterium]
MKRGIPQLCSGQVIDAAGDGIDAGGDGIDASGDGQTRQFSLHISPKWGNTFHNHPRLNLRIPN